MKIIDNKKIDLTDDEWIMYEKICSSYDTINVRGKDLFIDLFETDDDGIITFLKPPSKRQTSFEIFLFLISVFQQQHVRLMYKEVENICSEMRNKMDELNKKLASLEESNKEIK